MSLPTAAEIDDIALERLLVTLAGFYKMPDRTMPDWNHVQASFAAEA